MSFDSALHFSQVESGNWSTFQPVVLLTLWKFTHHLIQGPGGLFLLFMMVFMTGLGLFTRGLNIVWWKQILVFLLVLGAPVNVMLLPHIWKDVALVAFLMLSLGLFVASIKSHNRFFKIASFVSLGLAITFRFDAVLYLWPLVFYYALVFSSKKVSESSGIAIAAMKSVGFVVMIFVLNALLTFVSGAKKVTLWPTIALWDLAAVSIQVEKVLLPDFTTGENMTVSDLEQAFKPWANVPLFSQTKAGIGTGLEMPYSDEQYKTLLQSWLSLPFVETKAYAVHRWRLISELLRIKESDNKPKDLFYAHKIVKYKVAYPPNNSALNGVLEKWLKNNIGAFYFKPWFYLLFGLFALPLLIKRHSEKVKGGSKGGMDTGLAWTFLVCSVLNVLVMMFLAPAAETRYLIVAMNLVLLLWPAVIFIDGGKAKERC